MDSILIRRIGSVVIAVVAFLVMFGAVPKDHSTNIDDVMSSDSFDQSRAEGAPQQAVVNGWTSRNLLEIIALQTGPDRDERPVFLLGLGVLELALIGATARGDRQASSAHSVGQSGVGVVQTAQPGWPGAGNSGSWNGAPGAQPRVGPQGPPPPAPR